LVASLPLENADAPPDRRRSWKFGHGFDERWPWSDEVVLLKLLRGLSVLLGAVTIVLVHRLGRVSFPRRPAVADLGALLLATLPAWSYAHGVLDNGNLAATLAHVVLLLCATSLARGRLPLGLAVALGTSWAAALLAKLTALGLCL